jgi:hypothetical protein
MTVAPLPPVSKVVSRLTTHLRQWIEDLKTPGLERSRHAEILDQMQRLLESVRKIMR